jgi:hypothetical protein
MTRICVVAVFVLALAGCAASTGVLPAGPDTYTVTERFSGAFEADTLNEII